MKTTEADGEDKNIQGSAAEEGGGGRLIN